MGGAPRNTMAPNGNWCSGARRYWGKSSRRPVARPTYAARGAWLANGWRMTRRCSPRHGLPLSIKLRLDNKVTHCPSVAQRRSSSLRRIRTHWCRPMEPDRAPAPGERPYAAGDHHRGSPPVPLNRLSSSRPKSRSRPPQALEHFDQGNCIGMHRARLCTAPPDPHLRRESAAHGPHASAPLCPCCIRKG
jgi:hypothetical protein